MVIAGMGLKILDKRSFSVKRRRCAKIFLSDGNNSRNVTYCVDTCSIKMGTGKSHNIPIGLQD